MAVIAMLIHKEQVILKLYLVMKDHPSFFKV